MKVCFLTFFILLSTFQLQAQSASCSNFKNGKFKSTVGGRTVIIERNGSYQKEYLIDVEDSLKMSFNVNWLDDCTYTLTPTKEAYQKYPKLPKNALITVRMTNVTLNGYTQSSTSNFVNKTIVGKVLRLK